MRILISAYACEPNVGSEPGIGWKWATEAAKLGHNVTVLTRKNNRTAIENELVRSPVKNLAFVYCELDRRYQWNSFRKLWPTKRGIHFYWHIWHYPYHYFWQKAAYREAKKLLEERDFQLVHHITLGTIRRSTYMGELGIPFVFGPLGGGERTPWRLRTVFGLSGWLNELTRDLSILLTKSNPLIRMACERASVIYLKTKGSEFLVPKGCRHKGIEKLELGIDETLAGGAPVERPVREGGYFEILYVGRFLYWKGMDYGLRAFAEFAGQCKDARLTMLGKGPDEEKWKQLAKSLGIDTRVRWVQWVEKNELSQFYQNSDLFLFPSLHDSSGNVVLEAIAHGLPVLCLDLGGPAVVVDQTCAVVVSTRKRSAREVTAQIASEMEKLYRDRSRLRALKRGALNKREEYLWRTVVSDVYDGFQHGRGVAPGLKT